VYRAVKHIGLAPTYRRGSDEADEDENKDERGGR